MRDDRGQGAILKENSRSGKQENREFRIEDFRFFANCQEFQLFFVRFCG